MFTSLKSRKNKRILNVVEEFDRRTLKRSIKKDFRVKVSDTDLQTITISRTNEYDKLFRFISSQIRYRTEEK